MFERLINLIGLENFKLIQKKKVILIGLGGVGGYTLEALVRSGIQDITIVDGDIIEETNLNRQIIALNSNLEKYKTDEFEKRIKDINPSVIVKKITKFLTPEDITSLNLDEYDYCIDCVDDVLVKTELAKYCILKGIKLIMSLGTARKIHPEKLYITTLNKTCYDPLAKKLRTNLKDISKEITVLTSDEEPIKTENNVLGSTSFVPSVGGLLIASYVINDIISL